MNLKRHIPNAFTCANLLCGCVALIKIFEGGDLTGAAYLVGLALIFDFFDGFAARLLKVPSPIGKDLDSLADMVTFGVVPGMVMYKLIILAVMQPYLSPDTSARPGQAIYPGLTGEFATGMAHNYLPYFALIIPIFSCIRLARFNNDTRQSDSFIGLPTPANAMFICALPLIYHLGEGPLRAIPFHENPWVLCLVCCVMSGLLVAPLPLIALKFKNFGWADNKIRFLLIGLSALLLACFQLVAIPLIILLYILLSIVNNIFLKKKV